MQERSELDELVARIGECSTVIRDIDTSPAWKVIIKDMEQQRAYWDNNWQDIVNEEKLKVARIIKLATVHVLKLKEKYEADLKAAQERLEIVQNPETRIDKDYDTEGIEDEKK